ncbi:MAG: hypothetical protein L7F78_11970, partial [Syntrophales bacterium LBB04]|nr:hypothetical protein [Syntrophales bacterium LBB04]
MEGDQPKKGIGLPARFPKHAKYESWPYGAPLNLQHNERHRQSSCKEIRNPGQQYNGICCAI